MFDLYFYNKVLNWSIDFSKRPPHISVLSYHQNLCVHKHNKFGNSNIDERDMVEKIIFGQYVKNWMIYFDMSLEKIHNSKMSMNYIGVDNI